ncbi:glycogen synthase [Anaerohalosphaera lusitana]|uniref:Glycogen synthase n=1 Tax=Anaerohalosphaera lusitana TaxID=1936003 RepID=A0A1U9NPN7_9BACT|nr:hypothetical protein [Anaerohalosphaera lusitana]AQT69714.1 glycogen synthase [Anaerohalosphaera lusitana]
MKPRKTAVHITHEAANKIGGIGAVLEGFFTSSKYVEDVDRSILISALFTREGNLFNRLGPGGEVLYSSLDGFVNTDRFNAFRRIEMAFGVDIVYGRKRFYDPKTGVESHPEIVLIDVSNMALESVNEMKRQFFDEYGIESNRYEHIWDFEQWMRLGPVAVAVTKALGVCENNDPTVMVSHEYMGLPTALAARLDPAYDFKTVFYAHETATMRLLVEKNLGHDTMFYNALKQAEKSGLYVDDIFGDQSEYYKHALVSAARHCDNILAVGDYVVDELRFMSEDFKDADIDLTYNGIPAYECDVTEKRKSRGKLQQYCENLLGYRPDYVFTHVTRLVTSKGLWRDFRVLEHMEQEFEAEGKTGVLFLLSTEVAQRPSSDVYSMEAEYNWPVAHREGWPDLSEGEARFNTAVQEFNAKSKNIKAVFINQFGFTRELCGHRMPFDMDFMDLRRGCDVEFGQSVYEPFGIAQLESLTFGAVCVVTNVCGCAGFVRDITKGEPVKNLIVADYTSLEDRGYYDLEDVKQIGKEERDEIEHKISKEVATDLCARLWKTEDEMMEYVRSGYAIARNMNWDTVYCNYVSKSLHKAMSKTTTGQMPLEA